MAGRLDHIETLLRAHLGSELTARCPELTYAVNQLLVRSGREEQAMLMTLAGLVVVLSMVVTQISDLFTTIKNLFGL